MHCCTNCTVQAREWKNKFTGFAAEVTSFNWLGNASVSPDELEEVVWSGLLCSDGCPHDPNPDKEQKKDGWILRWIQSTSFLFTLEDDNTNQKSKFIHFSKTHEAVTVCVCTSIEQAAGTLNKGPRHPFFCKLWTTCNLQELNQRYFTNEFLQSQRNWIPFLVSKLFSWQDKGTC